MFWKTARNSQINTRSSHLKVLCQMMFLKIWENIQKKIIARVSFSLKIQAKNLKLSEAATGDVPQKKVFLKISQIIQKITSVRVSF